jgi:hypothetical protein
MKCLLENCPKNHDTEEISFWSRMLAHGIALHPDGHHCDPLAWKIRIGAFDRDGFFTDERADAVARFYRREEVEWREWCARNMPRTGFEWKRAFGLVASRSRTLLDKDEVRRAIRLSDLIGQHTTLRMRGDRGQGRCPFHDDRMPSFSVDDAKGLWHCHGCGIGGDVFAYVMKRYDMKFYDALKFCGELAGLHVDK